MKEFGIEDTEKDIKSFIERETKLVTEILKSEEFKKNLLFLRGTLDCFREEGEDIETK